MLNIFRQVIENFRFDVDESKSREENAEDVIRSAALLSGAVAVEPIPFADVLLITPVQAKMVLHLGKVYGFEIDASRAADILKELGATVMYGVLARTIMRGLLKTAAPVIGGVIAAPLVYGWTFALGRVAQRYFEHRVEGRDLPEREGRDILKRALKEPKPAASALGDLARELRARAQRPDKDVS